MKVSPRFTRLCKIFLACSSLFYTCLTQAQSPLPGNAIQLIGGYSRHGSGDMNGIVFGAEYLRYVTKRFSLNYNLRGSINDATTAIIVDNTITGAQTDASVRFTTAGVQLGINGGYSVVRNRKHELMISLGAFGRYQSASNGSDGYSIYYPPATGQPTVLIGYFNQTPQETYAFGAIMQVQYTFTIKNKLYIGALPGVQTDTNGDMIPQVALAVGRRF